MSARPIHLAAQPAPRQIGKYIVSHAIGEGAMGLVYKAVDPHIHRVVAIKTIRRPLLEAGAQDIAAAQRFRLEAQAAGRLNHPNIVAIYEYGQCGDDEFIAMEHVEGRSLLALTGRGTRLALPDVLAVMCPLLDALSCAHAQGVWHRDIKPANLIVTPDGTLKVTDFGIARIDAAGLTQLTSVLGSPGYMAPERYTGAAPDERVDLFSCGVLLHELLTGTAPFDGSPSEVMYQVLNLDPPPPSGCTRVDPPPVVFDAIVARALARHRQDRYASAAEMRAALLAAAVPAGVPARLSAAVTVATRHLPVTVRAPLPEAPSPSSGGTGAWDAQALERVEALLRPLLGPISRMAVREVARRSSSMQSLIAKLAADTLDADERGPFIARASALLGSCPPQVGQRREPSFAGPPSGSVPVLGDTPMSPAVVEQAERVLTRQIGPIAAVLAKQAARVAVSREQFFCLLADQAGEGVDRQALLAMLWRIR